MKNNFYIVFNYVILQKAPQNYKVGRNLVVSDQGFVRHLFYLLFLILNTASIFFHNFHVFPVNLNSLEIFLFHSQVALSQLIVVNLNSNCCLLPSSFNFHVSHRGGVQE